MGKTASGIKFPVPREGLRREEKLQHMRIPGPEATGFVPSSG